MGVYIGQGGNVGVTCDKASNAGVDSLFAKTGAEGVAQTVERQVRGDSAGGWLHFPVAVWGCAHVDVHCTLKRAPAACDAALSHHTTLLAGEQVVKGGFARHVRHKHRLKYGRDRDEAIACGGLGVFDGVGATLQRFGNMERMICEIQVLYL